VGQKVHPHAFRLGYIRNWDSIWFAKSRKDFADFIEEDRLIRNYISKNLTQAAVAKIEIYRASNKIKVFIWSARPGLIIGRKGSEIDRLKDNLQEKTGKQIFIDIKEIKSSAVEAKLIADNIAFQLEKRVPYRRAIKKAVSLATTQGVEGIKVLCSGRLGGSEIARSEKAQVGKVPLQTLRADIEYGFTEAHTTYGLIGVKVWVYKGEKAELYSKERLEADVRSQKHGRGRNPQGDRSAKGSRDVSAKANLAEGLKKEKVEQEKKDPAKADKKGTKNGSDA